VSKLDCSRLAYDLFLKHVIEVKKKEGTEVNGKQDRKRKYMRLKKNTYINIYINIYILIHQ
jgi:hypothetical protein